MNDLQETFPKSLSFGTCYLMTCFLYGFDSLVSLSICEFAIFMPVEGKHLSKHR